MKKKVLIWDVPTRVFHWAMVLMFIIAVISHDDNRYLDVHVFAGYCLFGLIVFRLLWGVVGTHYARFATFAYTPKEVMRYLKSLFTHSLRHYIGHNPAGAWAIFLLIFISLSLSVTGLLVLGGEERHGPLAGMLSFRQSVPFRVAHEALAYGMLALVFVHVSGVILESILHKENLIGAMFRGTKWVAGRSAKVPAHYLLGMSMLMVLVAYGLVNFSGYITETADKPYIPYQGAELPQNKIWNEACGECHLAFHPSLLPVRSWQITLDEQENHFEEDLMLEEGVISELRVFVENNSSEKEQSEAAWRINTTVRIDETPKRITTLKYWRKKHEDINLSVWQQENVNSKMNCSACHLDAEFGTFEDSAMRIPKTVQIKE